MIGTVSLSQWTSELSIDMASMSSRAVSRGARFKPSQVTVFQILAHTFLCLFENSDTTELTKTNKFFYFTQSRTTARTTSRGKFNRTFQSNFSERDEERKKEREGY